MSCVAVYCSSRTTKGGVKDPELSFHTFPKCPEIRSEWIKAVRRQNWEPTKYSRLCTKHFEQSCFETGLSIKKLKPGSVPTIFEGYPEYYQVAKKRKTETTNESQIIPRRRRRMQETGVVPDDIPTTPKRAVKMMTSLSKSRLVALRRLREIKRLRESKRRLIKRNATLLNVINALKNQSLLDTESLDILSGIGNKNKEFDN